jgi:hypothetical protein
LNKQMRGEIAATDEGECLEGDEGDEEGNDDQKELGLVNLSNATRIIDDDVPQAFSHWSWECTQGYSLGL